MLMLESEIKAVLYQSKRKSSDNRQCSIESQNQKFCLAKNKINLSKIVFIKKVYLILFRAIIGTWEAVMPVKFR
jgi:hypothetical protein